MEPIFICDEGATSAEAAMSGRAVPCKSETRQFFNYHAASMTERVGHWLSKPENKFGAEISGVAA